MVRTQQTAQFLSDELDEPIDVLPGLREIEAGDAIHATGDQRPVAFSHGGAIAVWTLLNADNADPALLESHPLNNTGYVVVHGSPADGWKLVDWTGTRV